MMMVDDRERAKWKGDRIVLKRSDHSCWNDDDDDNDDGGGVGGGEIEKKLSTRRTMEKKRWKRAKKSHTQSGQNQIWNAIDWVLPKMKAKNKPIKVRWVYECVGEWR